MPQDFTYQGIATNLYGNPISTAITAGATINASCVVTVTGQPTTWAFDPVSVIDTEKVTLKTEFESMPGSNYANTTSVTPIFAGPIFGTVIGNQVILTLIPSSTALDSTSSGSVGSSSLTNSSATSPSTTSASSTDTGSTTTSSLSNTTSRVSNASKTYTTGELAGAAVGCVIAGLLIASILAFLCLKRRERSRRPQYASKREVLNDEIHGNAFKLAANSSASWQRHLPQPESDQTISRLANRTLDDIELFVENFYADRPMTQAGGISASDLLPFSSPYLDQPLAEVVHTSSVPTVLFKHCIAYHLLQKIDPTQNNSSSLLPKEFVVPPKGDQKVLSQLRVLMAHSQSDNSQDETYLVQRDQAAETIVQQIERAFHPWAHGTKQDRARNLKGVLIHLSDLGNRLYSQPASFEWRWGEGRASGQGRMVMLPGLDKMTDAQAVSLATPICVVEPRLNRFIQ